MAPRRSVRPKGTHVFDHLVRRPGVASAIGADKVRVDPFGGGAPWLVSGPALEALEPLAAPNALVLWLQGRGASRLAVLAPRLLVVAAARARRTGPQRGRSAGPVARRELVDEVEGSLGARAGELVDAGLADLASRGVAGVRLVRGRLEVEAAPLAGWVERLVRSRGAEQALPLADDDPAREGRLLRWSLDVLVEVEQARARGATVDPADLARRDALVLPLAAAVAPAVLRKGARCLSRDGRRFMFAGGAPGEVPEDLSLRALERAVLGVARCEPRRAFARLTSVRDVDARAAVTDAVLTGVDLLRDEGALVPEGPREGALEGVDLARRAGRTLSPGRRPAMSRVADGLESQGRRIPREADAAAIEPCRLGADDLRSFVDAEWPDRSPAQRQRLTLGLVRALRRRAAAVLHRLLDAPAGRFEARALDLLTALDRSTIAAATGVPVGTLRGDFARSDPGAAAGPGRWTSPDLGAAGRPLPVPLRDLLPRRLRRFTNHFARVFPLVRFALFPQPHEVRSLAPCLEDLVALERLFFYPASLDERSGGAPSWGADALADACADAGVADEDALVRQVLLPFLTALVRTRAVRVEERPTGTASLDRSA